MFLSCSKVRLITYSNVCADAGSVKIIIYKGVQPQAVQLVGGFLPSPGGGGSVYNKVHIDRSWRLDSFYFLGDIHTDVLVC